MPGKKTPDGKKAGDKSQSANSSPDDEKPSPLARNSFMLEEHDSRTSNTRFGAIGGPTEPIARHHQPRFIRPAPAPASGSSQQAQQPFRHATDINQLSTTTGPQRTLQSNRPGDSYVLNLSSWRRGPEEATARATDRNSQRDQGRLESRRPPGDVRDEERLARANARAIEYQQRELQKYQAKMELQMQQMQIQEQNQQLVPARSQGFKGLRGLEAPRGFKEPFKPMESKIDPEKSKRPLTEADKMYRDLKGISHAYQGDSTNPANESADVPDSENCSVWITNLPPSCTYRDLLGAIAAHHPGKVYASYISPPSAQGPDHLPSRGHSAAKVVFYWAFSAQQLIYIANNNGFWVRGFPARVVPNRIRAAPQPFDNTTTRCLDIEGPADEVNRPYLDSVWNDFFSFDTENVAVVREYIGVTGFPMRRLIYRFGSHRAQAVAAMHYMHSYMPHVAVTYAADPCDVLPAPPAPPAPVVFHP